MNSEDRTAVAPQNYGELEIREEDGFPAGLLKCPVFLAAVHHACPGAKWGPGEQMTGVVILSPHPVPPTRTDAFPDKTCFHMQAPAQASWQPGTAGVLAPTCGLPRAPGVPSPTAPGTPHSAVCVLRVSAPEGSHTPGLLSGLVARVTV